MSSLILKRFFFFVLTTWCLHLYAQKDENWLVSSDEVFFMQVKREVTKVKITLFFINPESIDNVSIERSDINNTSYGQCKFIDFANINPKDTIVCIDNYPQPAIVDTYYRLRITSKDGVSRVYPAVKLLAVNDPQRRKTQ
jgi:hypothetical protein